MFFFYIYTFRVVAKKIVIQLRFSLNWSPSDLEQNFFCPQSLARWCKILQDGGRSTPKDNTLNKCSNQDFISITLLVIVTLILKVVRNLFQTSNLDGSIYVHKLETVHCPLPSEDQSN